MKGFLASWKWELGGALLLVFSVLVNLFPEGYTLIGGDVTQLIRLSQGNYEQLFYDGLGRYSLYYAPFYVLDALGASAATQLSFALGLFLLGSYASFFGFIRLVFPKIRGPLLALGALFYAANIYTLYLFTSFWGFTHYPVLYVFIPIMTGLFVRSLQSFRSLYPIGFLFVAALASMSFSNPAYALSTGIYFAGLASVLFVFKVIRFNGRAVFAMVMLAVGSAALNAYWILPTATQARAGVQEVSVSRDIDLSESLQKTSNAIFDTLRMVQTYEKHLFYPYNFPYFKSDGARLFLVVLSFAPIFLVLSGLFSLGQRWKEDDRGRWFLGFFTLLALFVPLVARSRMPFEFNDFIFQLPGLNVLRGYDKMAVFTPFLIVTLSTIALSFRSDSRYFRRRILGASFVVLLLALPFFTGGIQTRLSAAFSGGGGNDYRSARTSFLVSVPKEYAELEQLLPSPSVEQGKVTTLPFAPASSVGRIDLPKWKASGPDIVRRMISDREYVEPNEDYIPGIRFAQDFDDIERDPEELLGMYGLLGVRYIVYHKDVSLERFRRAELAREYMEERGFVEKIVERESFILYRIDERFVFPLAYAARDGFSTNTKGVVLEKAEKMRQTVMPLSFSLENPKMLSISVSTLEPGEDVFLNQKPDALWTATYVAPDGSATRLVRDYKVNFANAWVVDRKISGGTIEITHRSFEWLVVGMKISLVSLVALCLYFVYHIIRIKRYGKTD